MKPISDKFEVPNLFTSPVQEREMIVGASVVHIIMSSSKPVALF